MARFSEGPVTPCGDFLASPAVPAEQEPCSPSGNGRAAGCQALLWAEGILLRPWSASGDFPLLESPLGSLLIFGVWGRSLGTAQRCGENIPSGSQLRPGEGPVPWTNRAFHG